MESIYDKDKSQIYFLSAAAGCGKTYLYNTIIQSCSINNIDVIACATTGVAADLLDDGMTMHSALKIPLTCH